MRVQVRDLMLKVGSEPEECPSTRCPPGCGCTNIPDSCDPVTVEAPKPIRESLSILRDQMRVQMRQALVPA